jgi:hypothetical protein
MPPSFAAYSCAAFAAVHEWRARRRRTMGIAAKKHVGAGIAAPRGIDAVFENTSLHVSRRTRQRRRFLSDLFDLSRQQPRRRRHRRRRRRRRRPTLGPNL